MTITNPTPIVIPPTPQQEFPHLWISDIVVHAPTVDKGFIHIETKPYNQETKTIGSDAYRTAIRTDDLWKAANEVPEVAAAMYAIFQAIDPLRAWLNGGTPSVVTSPEPEEEVIVDEPEPEEVVIVDEPEPEEVVIVDEPIEE
jgi:hypothetical protein